MNGNSIEKEWKEADDQQPYACWLAGTEGISSREKARLTEYAGSPGAVYEMEEKELKGLLTEEKRRKLAERKERADPFELYEELKRKKIKFFSRMHPLYPARLKNIADAPYGLFVEGELPEETVPSVAVIGARQCSEYGRFMADMCGRKLADAGINVVSGMARGIDGISQNAALCAGGMSYAVLGCGTNVCYPAENRNIYIMAKKKGGIISEYPPDLQPRSQLFPPRNRIISGLSDLVLIIEARNRSGTLITADMALEQGRDVYVVPGRLTDPLSEGCNRLLKQGAGLMTSLEEMLEETGLAERGRAARAQGKGTTGKGIAEKGSAEKRMAEKGSAEKGITEKEMTEKGVEETGSGEEKEILRALDFYPKDIELLRQETGMEYRKLACLLGKLCMEGKADRISAGHFVLKAR